MNEYIKPNMKVIEFESEDVIVTSLCYVPNQNDPNSNDSTGNMI